MARKTTADAAKDKAAKQKKLIIILALVMVLAVGYAYKTMSGLNGAPAASKPQAVAAGAVNPPASAPAPTTPAPAAPTLAGNPVASTGTPAATPAATPSGTDSSSLVSVVIPTADQGQLQSFSRFESKDPFASSASSSPTAGTSGSGKGSSGSGSPPATPPTPPAPPAPPPTTAVISVNGTSESVLMGHVFPAANPVPSTNGLFDLVSLTAHTAVVSIVGGSYAGGSQTLTLKENKPVTLVNTADGTRYTLVLYPQGTVAPVSAPTGGSSVPPSAPSSPSSPGTTTTSGG